MSEPTVPTVEERLKALESNQEQLLVLLEQALAKASERPSNDEAEEETEFVSMELYEELVDRIERLERQVREGNGRSSMVLTWQEVNEFLAARGYHAEQY